MTGIEPCGYQQTAATKSCLLFDVNGPLQFTGLLLCTGTLWDEHNIRMDPESFPSSNVKLEIKLENFNVLPSSTQLG